MTYTLYKKVYDKRTLVGRYTDDLNTMARAIAHVAALEYRETGRVPDFEVAVDEEEKLEPVRYATGFAKYLAERRKEENRK